LNCFGVEEEMSGKERGESIVSKVTSELQNLDYVVKECMDTRRRQLVFSGRAYCLLSGSSDYHCCPLQQGNDCAKLSYCRREDYIAELSAKNKSGG
jgi:hypothetical protein